MTFLQADHHSNLRFVFTVVLLCLLWYTSSSASNILNKLILNRFPFPLTISMSSLLGTSLYSIPVLKRLRISHHSPIASPKMLFVYLVPIALGKIIATSSSYISLLNVPVSYAHTIKATMPLFTVFCARLLLGEHQPRAVYLSLLPIVCGVVIASFTEVLFSLPGLISALCSTFTYALLNSYVKRVLRDTKMHHVKLLSISSQIACLIFSPVWLLGDFTTLWSDQFDRQGKQYVSSTVLLMLACSGFLNCAQNIVTFTLIHKLTALSYSVANAAKRVVIITVSLLALKNPVTPWNIFGMLLAVFGVLTYNQAKQSHRVPVITVPDNVAASLQLSMSDPSFLPNGMDNDPINKVADRNGHFDYERQPSMNRN